MLCQVLDRVGKVCKMTTEQSGVSNVISIQLDKCLFSVNALLRWEI